MNQDYLFFTSVNILLAWSVYLVLLAGVLSLAQGAFMAIGCYVAGILTVRFGLPLLPAALIGSAAAAMLAVLIGRAALRVRGVYLIIVTLGFTVAMRVILENIDYVGGVNGFGGMTGASVVHVFVAVVVVGTGLFVLSRSPLQRTLDAAREDEEVAGALGIAVLRLRLTALAAGAAVAGLAGALYGHYLTFVRPDNFDINVSMYAVLYVILGGGNNFIGPLVGAVIMTLLPEYIRGFAEWRPTIFGLAIILILLFRPEGLFPQRVITLRAGRRGNLWRLS